MNTWKRDRFPPDIISYAVWLLHRFNLSHRDIEDLLAERGITVSRQSFAFGTQSTSCAHGAAAKRFFRRLRRSHGSEPSKIVIDKLRSYGVSHRELMPETIHSKKQYENNRAEQSHEATRARERGILNI
jgi:putative transposase